MTVESSRSPVERDDPYIGAIAIDYAAANQEITVPARGIYIAGAGDLAVIMLNGTAATFVGLLVGHEYRIAVKQITKVGSSASGLILV